METFDKGISVWLEPKQPFYLPGTLVEGRIILTPAVARIDALRVKFRGKVLTRCRRQRGQSQVTYRDQIDLFKIEQQLWNGANQSSASVAPDGIQFQFSFPVPNHVPPTAFLGNYHNKGSIVYYIEAVGERSGFFAINRRLRLPVTICSRDTLDATLLPLIPSWQQDWTIFKSQSKIRQKPWHERSQVNITLSLPSLPSFPAFASIPFQLVIEAVSRSQRAADATSLAFPCPPNWGSIQFNLKSTVWVSAGSVRGEHTAASEVVRDSVSEDRDEPTWETEQDTKADQSKGRWKHRVTFSGLFRITASPDIQTSIVALRHAVYAKVRTSTFTSASLVAPISVSSGLTDANMQNEEWIAAADMPPSYDDVWEDLDMKEKI